MRRLIAFGLAAVLASACTSSSDDSGFGCESAPEAQRHSASEIPLSVSTNPAAAGDAIALYVGSNETPGPDNIVSGVAMTGYGSSWQCWNGTDWVSTHLLVHGSSEPGETLPGEPGVTTTVPAIGLVVPFPYQVTVPAVAPGWYRIQTRITQDGDGPPDEFIGHVGVEVGDGVRSDRRS